MEFTPPEDIPSETVHAKTGYVEPEPTPKPTVPANRQAAIDAANAYAVTQYGVVTDNNLTLGNSAYRFPAAVPVDASQETLEAKARDMVDFTFRQLIMQAGKDAITDAASNFRYFYYASSSAGTTLFFAALAVASSSLFFGALLYGASKLLVDIHTACINLEQLNAEKYTFRATNRSILSSM